MPKPTIAITIGHAHYTRIFSGATWRTLDAFADVIHHPGDEPAGQTALIALLPTADACITSWMWRRSMPMWCGGTKLRAMAHAAGSVKRFVSDAVWARSIQVTSAALAWRATMAETTVGLMIVGAKRIWPLGEHITPAGWRKPGSRRANCTTAWSTSLAPAALGRHVIELLRPSRRPLLLYDPYVDAGGPGRLGVEQVARRIRPPRRHRLPSTPSAPSTYHMLDRALAGGDEKGRCGDHQHRAWRR